MDSPIDEIFDRYPDDDFGIVDDGACLCHDSSVCPDEIATSLEEEYSAYDPWGRGF